MSEHTTPPTTPPQPIPADESPTLAPREQLSGTQADAGQELTAGSPLKLPRMLGRYELRRLLGKGGMGAVYLAHDTQLDRPVALKIPSFASSGGLARERFVQEARAAALVSHPNLCPVYDAGAMDGIEYLTMAYIEGKPLSALIRGGKQLPERSAAALALQLARAMQAAHERGIIHRDLKPDNIMITVKKQPVIMDFGLARRSVGPGDVRLTQSGALLGTPAYMSPEQVDGDVQAMGPGCDIYSLGVILYQLLTGRLPFDPAAGFGSLIAQIVTDPPPPPSRFRPGLSPRLEAICLTALAKKPEHRHQSMLDLARELDSFIRSPQAEPRSDHKEETVSQEPVTDVFAEMVQTEVMPPTRTRVASRADPRKRRWAWWVGGGVVAAALLAVVIAVVVRAPKQGTVFIALSNPRAAVEVGIDGQRVAQDALGQPLSLPPGEHELTVRGAAFENHVQTFSLHAGQEMQLPVSLKAARRIADTQPLLQPETKYESEHPAAPPQPTPPSPPAPPPNPITVAKAPPAPAATAPAGPVPEPPEAEVEFAQAKIRKDYARQIARQNGTSWLALANRLRGQAEQMRQDPTQRYALWDEARELAMKAGSAALAIRICNELTGAFVMDALALKTATLQGVKEALLSSNPAIGGNERPELGRRAIAQALHVVDLAIRAKKFAMAWGLLELARQLQERTGEGESPVSASAAELAGLKPAFAKVDHDPEDAAANFQVGKFLCLVLEDWPAGLPLLAKAHDPLWRAAAQAELRHAPNAASHAAVGDAWFHLFRREGRGAERRRLGWRARAWYDLTLSEWPPAQRATLNARVREIGGAPNLSLIKPFFDADAASPKSGLPVHQTEPKFDMESGYAHGRWFMSTHGGHWYGGDIARYAAPFACQLTARVVSPPSAWYELVFSHENGKHSYIVRVDGAGEVELFMGDEQAKAEIPMGVIRPKGVRPQVKFRNLLVIGRGRQLDLYLDGVAVTRTPIRLPADIGPGQVHIGLVSGNNGGGMIEVKRLTVWPADGVPALKGRS